VKRIASLRDERGATLVEVTVATAAGVVVLFALTMMIVVTLHSSARVSARVDATRNARLTVSRITEQLRSSCVAPRVAPVRAGSTGTSLRFVHQTGSDVVLEPVLSRIDLVGGTLTQYDYGVSGGSMPVWDFEEQTPVSQQQLATGLAPIPPSGSVFTYLAYANKAVTEELSTPLSAENARRTVAVRVAFSAAPRHTPVADAGAAAQIRDTALLRLTSLAFNAETDDPCL
jgi:Flp pilus assembly pilin Flp